MKRCLILFLLIAAFLLSGCSDIDYSHPLDSNGSNNYQNLHPEYFQDDDNDSIANLWDPDHPLYAANKDTTPPVLTLLGEDTVKIPVGDPYDRITYYKDQFTVSDDKDPTVTKKSTSVVSAFPITLPSPAGQPYEIVYTAIDNENNPTTKIRYVILFKPDEKDTTKPEIFFQDNLIILQGDVFDSMSNVIATDNADGTITSKIIINGSVDTHVPKVYTLTYSVSDNAGNKTTRERTITVQKSQTTDEDWPVITLIGDVNMTLRADVEYVEPGYTAYDSTDGDITSKVTVSGTVKKVPGNYIITYQVKDNSDHSISIARNVKVLSGTFIDDSLPIIKLTYKKDSVMTIAIGGTWKIPPLTVEDNVDNIPADSVKYSPANFNTNVAGTFDITLYVTDAANNTGTLKIKVIVQDIPRDTTKPVITITGKNPDTIGTGSAYRDKGATALDSVDGDITVKIIPTGVSDVNTAITGTYIVTYTVSDIAENEATAERTVVVMDGVVEELIAKYEVPTANPLASINKAFTKVETEGTEVPNLSTVTGFTISWDLPNKGLHAFSFQKTVTPYYLNISGSLVHNFSTANPEFTVKSSEITGLDGEYYIKVDGVNLVWIRTDGSFAITWKP